MMGAERRSMVMPRKSAGTPLIMSPPRVVAKLLPRPTGAQGNIIRAAARWA